MANTPQSPGNDDIQAQRDIDEVFGNASPNPNRVGCPSRGVLIELATRRLPIGSPGYEHLSECSPCYREFRDLQTQLAATPPSSLRWRWMLPVAAALVLAVGGAWWQISRTDSENAPATVVALPTPTLVSLDLRPFSVTRGDDVTTAPAPLALPPAVIDATLLLPVGTEPGAYDVRLLDLQSRPCCDATGKAAIENYVTTLRVRMDLRQLATDSYQLAVRRQGDSWRTFPVSVR